MDHLRGWALRAFPHADVPNVRRSYFINAMDSAAFVSGNWIFFWTLFMSYSQLGLNDSLSFAFGLFMEIPTGALADVIGKRWTIRAALLLNGIGFLIQGSAMNIAGLIGGFLLFHTGIALYSGASEAMTYDSLKERGLEGDYDKFVAANSSLSLVVLMVAILAGAPMYHIDPRLPHWAWGIAFLIGFVVSLGLTEPAPEEEAAPFSLRGYLRQFATGAKQLWHPNLRYYIPMLFALPGMFFIYSWGVVQPAVAVNFGFGPDEQSIITSAAYVLIAVTVRFIPRIRRKTGDFGGLTLLNIGLVLALFGMALPLGSGSLFAAFILVLMHLSGSTSRSWTGIVINENTPSQIRATTLSTVALLTKLPYVLVAVIAGAMIDGGQLAIFVTGMATAALVLLGLSHVMRAVLAGSGRLEPVSAP